LRPGEKLFEEINYNTENMVPTEHQKIMRFAGVALPLEAVERGLSNFQAIAAGSDSNQLKLEIKKLLPEYTPYLEAV